MTVPDARRRIAEPTVSDLVWAVLIATYLATRVGAVLSMPIASIELHDLAAAWLEHAGTGDGLQPTLIQGVALVSFEWSESGEVVRWLAFAASATIPAAILLLRHRLGDVGAIVAMVTLTFSGPAIYLGSSASAAGIDLAVVAWGFVWLDRGRSPVWLWAVAGVLVAVSGPIVLLFAFAAGVTLTATRAKYEPLHAGLAAAGTAFGIALASIGFGGGWVGLAVPPLHHLSEGYDASLSGGSGGLLLPVYTLSGLAGALGGVLLIAQRWRRSGSPPNRWWITVGAFWLVALLWVVTMLTSGSPVPMAAAVIPSALLAGFAVDAWARRVDELDWRTPLLPYLGSAVALTATGYVLATWARRGESGDTWEAIVLVVSLVGAFSALTIVALGRRTLPTLVASGAIPALGLMLAGTFGVVTGSQTEPIFSPQDSQSGRDLRDLADQAANERGGIIVVHTSLEKEIVWAFRGLPAYAVSRDLPLDAAVAVLPAGSQTPEGFTPLEGTRRLSTSIEPPSTPLEFVQWMTDRGNIDTTGIDASIFVRGTE